MSNKPIIVVSRCLGFKPCRYNGQILKDSFIEKLKDFALFIEVCPEMDIGMEVPRNPVRIINNNGTIMLLEPLSGNDYFNQMNDYTNKMINSFKDVDGFILKSRSPSCGIKDVKIFSGMSKSASSKKGNGIFGGAVIERFNCLPIEDEGRLKNYKIREHFLTKLFLMKSFKDISNSQSVSELNKFHSNNKLLLMAYNQKELKILGRIAANLEKRSMDGVLLDYYHHLGLALARSARYTSNINVLNHAMAHFIGYLSFKEREFIFSTIEKYRLSRIPFSVPLYLVRNLAVRFEDEYLLEQTFFKPFPEELLELSDSGKGRI